MARKNIGFMTTEYSEIFSKTVTQGAMFAAEEEDVNLYIMAGGYFDAPYMDVGKTKFEYQNNYLFNFADKTNLDVLIILLGPIASNIDATAQKRFVEQYKDIPIITIGNKVRGYTNVSFDNRGGFMREVEYLITDLDKTKIGLVCGPATNEDAFERREAYKQVLTNHSIPVEDRKIVYGNFSEHSEEAVEQLLDQNEDLEAIVFSNDYMALAGYRVFEKRGIIPGKDIVVVAFDDSPFAALMSPSLTTTRANPAMLGYTAVKEAVGMYENTDDDIRIDTVFVPRRSSHVDAIGVEEKVGINYSFVPGKDPATKLVEQMDRRLLQGRASNGEIAAIKEKLVELVDWFNLQVYDSSIDEVLYNDLYRKCNDLTTELIKRFNSVSLVREVHSCLIPIYAETVRDDTDKALMYQMMADCFQNALLENERRKVEITKLYSRVTKKTMEVTRMIVSDREKMNNTYELFNAMDELGFSRSYMLLFKDTIRCRKNGDWVRPGSFRISACQIGDKSFRPEEDKRELTVEHLFECPDVEDGSRKTYLLSFLFANDEQYGILVAEPKDHEISVMEAIAFQISSAIQTVHLIRGMDQVRLQLADSLEKQRKNNEKLELLSKSDELTQLYNRRGFMTAVEEKMKNPSSKGKRCVVLYGDINNVNLINDKFGHEEGNFAIRGIAEILRETLGGNQIIGRLGGDEFAAFLISDNKDIASSVREKIDKNTEKYNEGTDKPYYISMCVGVSSFVNDGTSTVDEALVRADVDLYLQKKRCIDKVLK
ncbi:MAG TPA: hypothetical protein DCG85_04915 [Lachnospiraceae bacterium]|nr:hypothetical protein [Lachnospiraceae bacterium]